MLKIEEKDKKLCIVLANTIQDGQFDEVILYFLLCKNPSIPEKLKTYKQCSIIYTNRKDRTPRGYWLIQLTIEKEDNNTSFTSIETDHIPHYQLEKMTCIIGKWQLHPAIEPSEPRIPLELLFFSFAPKLQERKACT